MDKIDYRFKFLYLIGILSIIISHCGSGGIDLLYNWFPFNSFFLALFAFTSGYFFREIQTEHTAKYILYKFKKLIIPLYLYNLFYGILVVLLRQFGFTIGGDFTLHNLFIEPLKTGHQFAYNLPCWFVIPLFMVEVFFILFYKLLKKCRLRIKNWFLFLFALSLGLIGIYIAKCGYNTGWWLTLTRFLYFVPFYSLGILYKNNLEKLDTAPNVLYFSIIFILQLLIITIYGQPISYSIVWCNNFIHNIFLPFIIGIIGIAFWLRIGRILIPVLKDSKYLKIITDSSYSIMANQIMGFMFVKTTFAILSRCTTLCNGFDMTLYKTDIWYFYRPNGIFQWEILYITAGITLPIAIQLCINKVKNIIMLQCKKLKRIHR